jgi:hypothetical protein
MRRAFVALGIGIALATSTACANSSRAKPVAVEAERHEEDFSLDDCPNCHPDGMPPVQHEEMN